MKKRIIVGAMLISTVVFAKGYNNQNGMGRNLKNNTEKEAGNFANLSEEQISKLQTLRTEHLEENQETILELEGLNIEIEKLLAEEKVDWKAVKTKTSQVTKLEAELELDRLKSHEEVKAILGDDMPMLAFGQGRMNKGGMHGDDNGNGRRQGAGNKRENGMMRGEFREKRESNNQSDLSDEQLSKIDDITADSREENAKLGLELAAIDNDIQKLLIADEINWQAVEAKINAKINTKTKIKINNYESREKIEDITGREIIGRGDRKMPGNRGGNAGGMGRNFK